jgi:hypothetical protein
LQNLKRHTRRPVPMGVRSRPASRSGYAWILWLLSSTTHSGLANLTRQFGILAMPPRSTPRVASGGQAIGTALKAIRRNEADYMLAVGSTPCSILKVWRRFVSLGRFPLTTIA